MNRLSKFLNLPSEDRKLLLNAALVLGAVRLALFFLPFSFLRAVLPTATRVLARCRGATSPSVDRLAWAVCLASRFVPRANNCLTRAVAARALFALWGEPTEVHLGVAKDVSGRLVAHAWLKYHGKVVLGGPDVTAYTPLCPL